MKKNEVVNFCTRTVLLVVFFIIPCVSIFSLDVAGTTWKRNIKGVPGLETLIFGTDRSFMIGVQDTSASGTYVQTGNDITLNYTFGAAKDKKLTIKETDSLFANYMLIGSGGDEWFSADRPKEGEKRKFNGIAAYVYSSSGTVNENARMREGPGTQYNFLRISESSNNSVPKGGDIIIYGKSENQTTIGGVDAYWYLCSFMPGYWGSEVYGWVWGGLIDFEK